MKKKNKIANIIMSVAIGLILVGGLLYVGNLQSWFVSGEEKAEAVVLSESVGVLNVERDGVIFSLEPESVVKENDIIVGEEENVATYNFKESGFSTVDGSSIAIDKISDTELAITIEKGNIIAQGSGEQGITLTTKDADLIVKDAIITVSEQSGSTAINVLKGKLNVNSETVKAGESILLTGGDQEVGKADLGSYSDMYLSELVKYAEAEDLVFGKAEIENTLEERKVAKEEAQEAGINGGLIPVGNNSGENNSSTGSSNGEVSGTGKINTCTISIRTDTILKNMDQLTTGKDIYVPANGTVLATTTVQFQDGDTVFDVLKRVTDYAGIQMEYSYFPVYESHYIEGINHLYEFDCGQGSGWTYKVNGWKPNYGVTKYVLQDGDSIEFAYTCDYGNDL